jgi:hypothetical protein
MTIKTFTIPETTMTTKYMSHNEQNGVDAICDDARNQQMNSDVKIFHHAFFTIHGRGRQREKGRFW